MTWECFPCNTKSYNSAKIPHLRTRAGSCCCQLCWCVQQQKPGGWISWRGHDDAPAFFCSYKRNRYDIAIIKDAKTVKSSTQNLGNLRINSLSDGYVPYLSPSLHRLQGSSKLLLVGIQLHALQILEIIQWNKIKYTVQKVKTQIS